MFCPQCGKTNISTNDQHPNDGTLFVAEDCESSTETFDCNIVWFTCNCCDANFYVSMRDEDFEKYISSEA